VPGLAIDQPALVHLAGPAFARDVVADAVDAEVHVADLGLVAQAAADRVASDLDQVVVIACLHALLEADAYRRRDVDITIDRRDDIAHEGVVPGAVPAAGAHPLHAWNLRGTGQGVSESAQQQGDQGDGDGSEVHDGEVLFGGSVITA
jgi:hypothetical protein